MKLTDRLSLSDDVVTREVAGEWMLLDLVSGDYFGLQNAGGRAWQLLDEQALSVSEICDRIEAEFDVGRQQLEQDMLAFAEDLCAHGLLVKQGS